MIEKRYTLSEALAALNESGLCTIKSSGFYGRCKILGIPTKRGYTFEQISQIATCSVIRTTRSLRRKNINELSRLLRENCTGKHTYVAVKQTKERVTE